MRRCKTPNGCPSSLHLWKVCDQSLQCHYSGVFCGAEPGRNAQGAKQISPRPQTGVECIHTSHACKGKPKERHKAPHQEWPCSLMPSGCLALPSDHFQLKPMQDTWPCECMVACMCVDTLINHGKHRQPLWPGLA